MGKLILIFIKLVKESQIVWGLGNFIMYLSFLRCMTVLANLWEQFYVWNISSPEG